MTKKISVETRREITRLAAEGHPSRSICEMLRVGKGKVSKYIILTNLELPKCTAGRPKSIGEYEWRIALRSLRCGKVETATEIQKMLRDDHGVNVTVETVQKNLNASGCKARKKKPKPRLSKKNIENRLKFAKNFENYTDDDWKRVIWSDESKVNRFQSDGNYWTWTVGDPNTITPNMVIPTVKHGGGSVMIWGCFGWNGVGSLCRIEGRMNSNDYKQILATKLLPSIGTLGVERSKVIFQHDNDPKHKSQVVTNWLKDQKLEVLDWPSQSPDLNPIEHLWAHLKRKLREYERQPAGMNELYERIEVCWREISVEACRTLIKSMRSRLKAVIKAKGGWTRY